MKAYQQIARRINNNFDKAEESMLEHFPSGSGFDDTAILNSKSTKDKLIINFGYHCMNENGYYDGWLNLAVIITPSLSWGYNLKINWHGYRNKYKYLLNEYLWDTIDYALQKEIEE